MNVSVGKKLGRITKGRVNEWKKSPGDDTEACHAAAFYAKKNNQNMVVVPGNSYGRFVLHIARENDDLAKYAPGKTEVKAYLVNSDGEVFEATATR